MSESPDHPQPEQPNGLRRLPSSFTPPNQQPRIGNGRYRLLLLHATGGMARIYRALDTELNREVALKILEPEMTHDPVRVERFRLEARRVASLRHPRIVPLLNYGEERNIFYLVMPFYPHTLRDALQSRKTFPLTEVVALSAQVASALDYAHHHGLIHRDVKPENILLDEADHALLGDFGISKADVTAPRSLATGLPLSAAERGRAPLVSLEYTAPEFLMGQPFDGRVDVYGLGIVVYEMLTGRVPFPLEGGGASVVIMRMLTEPANPPTLLAPGLLPFTTDAVVLRALESDPRRRYATASEFSRDLAQIVSGEGGDSPFAYPQRRAATTVPLGTSPNFAPPRLHPYGVASPPKPSPSRRWWLCSFLHRRRHD